jgi:hypothetical protein
MTNREGKIRYRKLMDSVAAILFRHDPAMLNFGFNPDEYRPEAETIVARLEGCRTESDVRGLVARELYEWFDEHTADSPEVPGIASDIWRLIERKENGDR